MVTMWHVGHALEGVTFPAQHWELGAWAEHNGAGVDVRNLVADLPEGTYFSLRHVANELGAMLLAPAGTGSSAGREMRPVRLGGQVPPRRGYRRVPGGRAAMSA
jgi:hypothetical protein